MGAKKTQKLLEAAAKFVVKHEGVWDHAGWEHFLEEAADLGVELSDESRRNLGNVLEAAKFFYVHLAHPEKPKEKKKKSKTKVKTKPDSEPEPEANADAEAEPESAPDEDAGSSAA